MLAICAVLGLAGGTRPGVFMMLTVITGLAVGMIIERRIGPPSLGAVPMRGVGAVASLTLLSAWMPPILDSRLTISIYLLALAAVYFAIFERFLKTRPSTWSGLALGGMLVAIVQLCLVWIPNWLGAPLGLVLAMGIAAWSLRRPLPSAAPLNVPNARIFQAGMGACAVVYLAFLGLLLRNAAPPRTVVLTDDGSSRYGGMLRLSHGPWFLDADGFLALAMERGTENPYASGDLVRVDVARGTAHEGWPLDPSPSWHISGFARSASGNVALVFANSLECVVYVADRNRGAKTLGRIPRSAYSDLIAVDWNGDDLEMLTAAEHFPYRPCDPEVITVSPNGSVSRRTLPAPRPVSDLVCTVEAASRENGVWKMLVSAAPFGETETVSLRLFTVREGAQPHEIGGVEVSRAAWKGGSAVARVCGNVITDYGFACLYDPAAEAVSLASDRPYVTANFRLGEGHLEPLLVKGRAFLIGSDWITIADVDGGLRLQRGGQTGPVLTRERALIEHGRLIPADARSVWLVGENGDHFRIDRMTLVRSDTQNWVRRVLTWWDAAPLPATFMLLLLSPLLRWLRAPTGDERAITLAVIGMATIIAAAETLVVLSFRSAL